MPTRQEVLGIGRGNPFLTEDRQRQRLEGLNQGYLSGIMSLPMLAMEYLSPDAGYTPGELRSSPQDRMRGNRFAWDEYTQERSQDPDYAVGSQLGNVASYVADPFFDAAGLGAARIAPKVVNALRLASPKEIKGVVKKIINNERGSLNGGKLQDMNARELKAKILRDIRNAIREGNDAVGIRVFHEDQSVFSRGDELPNSYNWDDGDIDLADPIDGMAVFHPDYIDEALSYSLGGGERIGVVVGDSFADHAMPEAGAAALKNPILYGDAYGREPLKGVWDRRGLAGKLKK